MKTRNPNWKVLMRCKCGAHGKTNKQLRKKLNQEKLA